VFLVACYPPNLEKFAKKYPPTASKKDIDLNKDFDEDFWGSLADGIELFVGSSEVEVLEDKVNELSRLIQKPERFEDLKGASLSAFMTGFYLFASSSVLSGIFAIERNTRKD